MSDIETGDLLNHCPFHNSFTLGCAQCIHARQAAGDPNGQTPPAITAAVDQQTNRCADHESFAAECAACLQASQKVSAMLSEMQAEDPGAPPPIGGPPR